jgi:hypothetical protein
MTVLHQGVLASEGARDCGGIAATNITAPANNAVVTDVLC